MKKLAWYLFFAALAFVALAFLWASSGDAQTPCPTGTVAPDAARVCWTNATQNTDGTPIPATGDGALRDTRIDHSICRADGTFGTRIDPLLIVTPDVGFALFEGLIPGEHCFQVRHSNNANVFSNWTGPARKTTTAPPPPAPPKPNGPTVTIA